MTRAESSSVPTRTIFFAAGHHAELVNHQFEALLCSALT